jgi:glycosyltransferase involved in cell wall biosynthesis
MISVVMPVYNGERFLAEAMESLLAQTFRDFEVVAVDDGSTDRTGELLHRFEQKDARVRVVRGDHAGISAALNRGIESATHDWIARMDADDVAAPDRFKKQLAAAVAHPNVVVWGSYAQHVDSRGNVLGVSKTGPTSEEEFRKLRGAGEDVYVIHPTSMLRRDVVLKVGGYDSKFNYCEDFELFDRMAEHGAVVAIPEPLLLYRIHATSISMQRFSTMRRLASFVRARQKARLEGRVLSYAEFDAGRKSRWAVARAADTLHTTSGFYYRKAGLAASEGSKAKAAAYLATSALLNPAYAFPRVWNQVLASKVKRLCGMNRHTHRIKGTAVAEDSAVKPVQPCCPS